MRQNKSWIQHACYEIIMLIETGLQELNCKEAWYVRSAYAESFMIHLRCLCHFFQDKSSSFPDDVFARKELPEWSRFIDDPDTKRFDLSALNRINKKVAHLTTAREAKDDKNFHDVRDSLERIEPSLGECLCQIHRTHLSQVSLHLNVETANLKKLKSELNDDMQNPEIYYLAAVQSLAKLRSYLSRSP